ncbi:MAG TPA: DUF3618 domain-containing protein [Casimicrobiaceae bacterium]|nr:DUF3618 domain-containing protein [Casimicrobiaceae bacterium]
MKSSEQLEREAEDRRARISETIDELRSRMTPGQVADEMIDYARRSGGGTFVRNLGQQVVERPLPVVLIGAGLAWLMLSNGRALRASGAGLGSAELRDTPGRVGSGAREAADRVASGARDVADSASATASGLFGRAKSVVSGMRSAVSGVADSASTARQAAARSGEAAGSLIERVRSRASSAYEGASEATRRAAAAVGDSTAGFGRSVGNGSQQFMDFCREQPLVLAGLGVAVGAAIGAALPASEAEDRLMGEASDDVKERVRRVAGRVKDTARDAYEDIKQTAASGSETDASGADASATEPAHRSVGGEGQEERQPERSAAAGPSASIDEPTAMRGGEGWAEPRGDRNREPR